MMSAEWEVVCFDAVADDDHRSTGGGELQEVARYPAGDEADALEIHARLEASHDHVAIYFDDEEWMG